MYKLVSYVLVRLVIGLIVLLVLVYDATTFFIYLWLQKPWQKWWLMRRDRSVPDSTANNNNNNRQIVRKSIKPLPDHFLNHCQTIDEAFDRALEIYGAERRCIGFRSIIGSELGTEPNEGKPIIKVALSDYRWITWREFTDSIAKFGHGLKQKGIVENDRVMIFADTCPQWFIASQAIIKNGSVLVTLYSTLGEKEISRVIDEIETRYLITTKNLLAKLIQIPKIIDQLRLIILLEHNSDPFITSKQMEKIEQIQNHCPNSGNGHDDENLKKTIDVCSFESILASGNPNHYRENPIKNQCEDVAIIMYTSGSVGVSKGVQITHKNLLSGLKGHVSLAHFALNEIERHCYIGYLPLAHILEFGTETMVLLLGCRLGYSTPHTLTDLSPGLMAGTQGDATLLKPTIMAAVPLVLDRIRRAIYGRLNQRGFLALKFFEFLVEYKTFWTCQGFQTPLLDRLFFERFQSVIGGKLEVILCGGAPLTAVTQKLLRACLNVIFAQGYGSTETIGGGLFMDEHDHSLSKVGGPLYGTKIKLVNWEKGGYCVQDKPNARGSIHLSCDSLSIGYFNLEHLNQKAFYWENGERWFKTGDIGELFPNGTFKIIDRKKDFIKLPTGEYVSLGKIETKLKTCDLVNQICVVGDSFKRSLIGLVVPNHQAMGKIFNRQDSKLNQKSDHWHSRAGVQVKLVSMEKSFRKILRRHGRKQGLTNVELPTEFILLFDEEWSPENGLVTASYKIKRKNIEQRYAKQIVQTFNQLE